MAHGVMAHGTWHMAGTWPAALMGSLVASHALHIHCQASARFGSDLTGLLPCARRRCRADGLSQRSDPSSRAHERPLTGERLDGALALGIGGGRATRRGRAAVPRRRLLVSPRGESCDIDSQLMGLSLLNLPCTDLQLIEQAFALQVWHQRIRDPHACEFATGRFRLPLSLSDGPYCWGCNGRIIFDTCFNAEMSG